MEKTNLEGSTKESEDKLEAKSDEWFSSKNINAFCFAIVGLAMLALGIANLIFEKPAYPVFQILLGIINLFMAYRWAFSKRKEGQA
jgi:hypothetical protein